MFVTMLSMLVGWSIGWSLDCPEVLLLLLLLFVTLLAVVLRYCVSAVSCQHAATPTPPAH